MTPFPQSPEFLRTARRIVWSEDAATALSDPYRFSAYAFRYAAPEDTDLILSHIGEEGLRDALDHASPGIMDGRSWCLIGTRRSVAIPRLLCLRVRSAEAAWVRKGAASKQ